MSIEKYILFLCVSYRGESVAFSNINFGPRTLSGAFAENERTRRIKIKDRKCHKLNMTRGLEHPSGLQRRNRV